MKPTSIAVSGGRIEAAGGDSGNPNNVSIPINDAAGVQGDFRISPETVGAVG